MKTPSALIWFVVLGFVSVLNAQAADDAKMIFEKASGLATAGNHREAADVAKTLLDPAKAAEGKMRAYGLQVAVDSLKQLSAADEAETVIEKAAADFPNDWRVLRQAGGSYFSLPHFGMVVDGSFQRGQGRNRGVWKNVQLRDRVRMLQLTNAASQKIAGDASATADDKADVIDWLILGLSHAAGNHAAAWKLQILTDLSKLPDYDDQEGADGVASGYPVDAKGEPVFFEAAASWETAASDGERLFWLLDEKKKLGGEHSSTALEKKAEMLRGWFSVRSLAMQGWWGRATTDDAKSKQGIAALHTLTGDETVAKLATGPKRFALPPEQNFMRLYIELTTDENMPTRGRGWTILAEELTDRRQYSRAAELLKKAIESEKDAKLKSALGFQLNQITGNWTRLEPLPAQPAGKGAKLSLVFRNATKISFTARKVDVLKLVEDTKAWLRAEPQEREDWWRGDVSSIGRRLLEKDQEKYLGVVVAKWETELEPAADHWDKRIEIATSLQNGGAYFIEGQVEKGNTARALLWIEDLVLVQAKQKNGELYCLADAVTGAPVVDATVSFFGYRRDYKDTTIFRRKPRWAFSFSEFSEQPDEQGVVKEGKGRLKDDHQWLVVAKDMNGRLAVSGFSGIWFPDFDDTRGREDRIYVVTDRPVYRPAQTMKWKAWVRTAGYDPKTDFNRFAGKRFDVVITNPRGEKIVETKMDADDNGSLNGELALAEDAQLGAWSIHIWRNNEVSMQQQFRVEEYKKPELEVKVDAPERPVALGEAFEVKVKADYYFGGPVKEGKVKYRIERTVQNDRWFPSGRWDWLFGEGCGWRTTYYDWYPGSRGWCRLFASMQWQDDPPELVRRTISTGHFDFKWLSQQNDPPELVASGEQVIGADGTITIKVDTALAKEMHGDQDHKYSITAEVTDSSRRTIFGNGTVLAARRPFEVYVWMDRGYYQSGEAGNVTVDARTLDGKPVKAEGEIKIFRVTYDADGKPSEREVHKVAISLREMSQNDLTRSVRSTLKWDKAGQYRVSVMLKDEAGHEIEGVAFTTVRGADLNNGKGLRFDDLELAVQKDEYAPGDEVEVLVNANRENARVALFIRALNGVYPDPVWLQLDGKSVTHRFKIAESDQPNVFIEAVTVSDAKVHRVTRQIIVPPSKRIATVELITDKKEYLPREKPAVKLRVKDQNGQPFVGDVVLTGYDKALEYISGGSDQEDIREYFWGWTREHEPSVDDSLRQCEVELVKQGEVRMQGLGIFSTRSEDRVFDYSRGIYVTMNESGIESLGKAMVAQDQAVTVFSPPMAAAAMPAPKGASSAGRTLAMAEEGGGSGGGVGGGGPLAGNVQPPMIRTNLADSAVWIASVKTDAAGEAALDFSLPDNLTTWKLRSWVMGPQTQVGEASVEVVTRKNLMVRLQAPRFFVEKDEVTISANVHNEMDKAQEVRAELELEGVCLELGTDGKMPSLLVAAHSEKRFDWKVKVIAAGEAKIRVKALAQDDSDAMEMTFPVFVHGALKADSWSLALRPEQNTAQIKVRVPAERRPEATRLEVRWSPTLAMSLVDALPYLADYPYGCTEQTLNRFVPTVITLGVLRDLGVDLKKLSDKQANLNAQEIGDPKKRAQRWQGKDREGKPKRTVFDEAEVRRMASAGLQRLEAMRNGDGGWGWFPGGRESSEHITAVVLHGLHLAREAGTTVPEDLFAQGVAFLDRHEQEELRRLRLPEKADHHKPHPDNLDALVHSVLVEQKRGDKDMRARLYEHRQKLSRYNMGLLGLTCHALGEHERRDMLLRNLRQFLKQDDENQTAYLDLAGGSWWYWYDDETETQAMFLKLLSATEPKGDLPPRVAKYLLNNRRNGSYWNSTKDTAAVIEALAAFVKASGEREPDVTVEVLVDGKKTKEARITKENLFDFDGTLVIEGDALGAGEHTVEFRKKGTAPLYANAYLTAFSKEDVIPAAGLEVKVRRAFYRLVEEKPGTNVSGARGQVIKQQGFKYSRIAIASDAEVRSGDLIEVELTVESKNDYEYLIIEDPKPAGYEPVEVRSGWSWEGLQSYQEFRDEKVAFFAERLPRGTHNLRYRVKAEIPGRFSALPTKVEAMYAPELRGNAEEFKARVVEAAR